MQKAVVVVSVREGGLGWNVVELEAPDGQPVSLEVNDGGGFARTLAILRVGPSRTLITITAAGEA